MTIISHGAAQNGVTGIALAAAGNGRRVTVFVGQNRSSYDATSALIDGVACTAAGAVNTSATNYHSRIFYMLDADLPAGAGSYDITTNGTAGTKWVAYLYEEGVPQVAPTEVISGSSSVTTVSAAFTTAAAGATCFMGVTHTQQTGSLTEITDTTRAGRADALGSPAADYFAGYSTTNLTVGCTVSANGSESWYGVAFNASSGSTGDLAATESGADTLAATGGLSNAGVRLTLRDTDTGALAASLTGLIVSIRANSDDEATLAKSASESTDGSGVLEFPSGAIGDVADWVYVTVEKSDNSIVAAYRVQVIDLNA